MFWRQIHDALILDKELQATEEIWELEKQSSLEKSIAISYPHWGF